MFAERGRGVFGERGRGRGGGGEGEGKGGFRPTSLSLLLVVLDCICCLHNTPSAALCTQCMHKM